MANPTVSNITSEWTWVKVATDIIIGSIHLVNRNPRYYRTYRLTGEAAPSAPSAGTMPDEAIQIFINTTEELIRTNEAIDVYLFCVCYDRDNMEIGKVVVDT